MYSFKPNESGNDEFSLTVAVTICTRNLPYLIFFFLLFLLRFTVFAEIHSVALYNQKIHHNVCIRGSKTCKKSVMYKKKPRTSCIVKSFYFWFAYEKLWFNLSKRIKIFQGDGNHGETNNCKHSNASLDIKL